MAEKIQLLTHNSAAEYYFQEGCYITELLNQSEDHDVSIAKARLTPGTQTRWHKVHHSTERYVIIHGFGRVELGEDYSAEVGPMDVVVIPPGVPQRIINICETDLTFLAICSPRFEHTNYEDTVEANR